MKVSYSWLKEFVSVNTSPEIIADRLTMAGLEVKKIEKVHQDFIFETEITSNRPDWLSHIGVAREVSAIENKPLKKLPKLSSLNHEKDAWTLSLDEKIGCPYYTGISIEGIEQNPTPTFMKERLEGCGIRSISLIVDITNYVLLETGQPLHAFDSDCLQGQSIIIRRAHAGEVFIPIKGIDVKLDANDLVIADSAKAVALAGVMGGKNSEIQDTTKNVFLESAFFNPQWVRQASLRHAIKTDSSYRFERRVDPEMVDQARDRALSLIIQYATPKKIGQVHRVGKKPTSFSKAISLNENDVESSLGLRIPHTRSAVILSRLGLKVKSSGKKLLAVPPSFRPDLTRPIDLIEEIARIYGYDKIPETLPRFQPLFHQSTHEPLEELIEKTGDFLTGQGFYETITFSLVGDSQAENPVPIVNPMNQNLNQMRSTFLPSLLNVVRTNLYHQAKSLAFFEIANLYTWDKKQAKPLEEKSLALCLYGDFRSKNWNDSERLSTYYDLKGVVEEMLTRLHRNVSLSFKAEKHSGMSSDVCERIFISGTDVGYLGEADHGLSRQYDIEGKVFYAELNLSALVAVAAKEQRFKELPKYPMIERDLALIVEDQTKSGNIESMIRKLGGDLVVKTELFDIFRGGRIPKGFKNLAYRVSYQSPEKTLRSEDIQNLHTRIASELQEKFKATFQSQ